MSDNDYGRRPLGQDGRCFMCERGIPKEVVSGETYHVERLTNAKQARRDGTYKTGRILCLVAHPTAAARAPGRAE